MSKCVITEQDHLEFIGGVLHINGKPHPSLQGCIFKGNVKFAIPIKEVAPPPVAPAPQREEAAAPTIYVEKGEQHGSQHVAPKAHTVQVSEKQVHGFTPRGETVESVGELGELKEIMDIGRELMDLPPWMGAVVLLGFLYMKMNGGNNKSAETKSDKQPSTCKGHAAMEARLSQLENANLSTRVQRLEDDVTKSLLDSVKELRTPPPQKIAAPEEEEQLKKEG